MWKVKNLKTNEEMRFETMQDVAEWFNFFEDIYDDGVWDRFIKLHPSYEFKLFRYDIIGVDKNFITIDKEGDDDLPF